MAWVNYRETVERFNHIDAELIRFTTHAQGEETMVELTVRFYPWWEHPLYVAAIERGKPWGFSDDQKDVREVTVRAIRPQEVQFLPVRYVTDFEFTQDDPLLWKRSQFSLFINGPLDRELLLEGLLREGTHATRQFLSGYLLAPPPQPAPYALALPIRFYEPALRILAQLEVPAFCPYPPTYSPPLVAFYFGGGHILAEDFEVDVPDFIHKPEWFQPTT